MFSFQSRPSKLCDSLSRRELLRVGGLGALGLSLPNLLRARETAPLGVPPTDKTFGRAKNVIFLYLAGGPPQHETFDPKPNAPVEISGPFNPISTNIPGIQFCELLPRTARLADKLAVVRSMATDDNTHSSSGYWVLTGYKYVGPNARTIQPTDWPYFGSIVKRYKPSEILPPLSTVWVPDIMRLNENVTPAGQTAGFMGNEWDPNCFVGDPSDKNYRVEGLRLADRSPDELASRRKLLAEIESPFEAAKRGREVQLYDKFQQQAFELLTSGKAQDAFAIQKEPAAIRRRYGHNRWGQCVLLARRLVEAGVRLVHVQWPREPGDNAVDNPLWDTHAQNADRVEDVLCPQFDVGFSALIEDLDQRGLLDETLVVAIGGLPALHFDGKDDFLHNTETRLLESGAPRTIIVVGRLDDQTGGALFTFGRQRQNGSSVFIAQHVTVGGKYYVYSDGVNASGNTTVSPERLRSLNEPFVTTFVSEGNGHKLRVRVNGADLPTTQPGSVAADKGVAGFTIGSREDIPPGQQIWNGDISEILVYDRALSDGQLRAVGSYLATKYKLATSYPQVVVKMEPKLPDEEIVTDLYFAAFCRPPFENELQAAVQYVNDSADRRRALEDVAWALMNSKEFLFQH